MPTYNFICEDCMEYSTIIASIGDLEKLSCALCGSLKIKQDFSKHNMHVFCKNVDPINRIAKPTREMIKKAEKEGKSLATIDKISQMAESARNRRQFEKRKKAKRFFDNAIKDIDNGRSFIKENLENAKKAVRG